jgi:hypothetical protein
MLPDGAPVDDTWKAAAMSSTDDEIRSGWMTPRDAELFRVLARGLTDDERSHVADVITRVDTEADQHVRSSRRRKPTAEHDSGTTAGPAAPTRHLRGEHHSDDRLSGRD